MNDKDFYISDITDAIYDRILGKSYPEGCPVSLSELKYIHVLHTGFDGRMHVGEMIVGSEIAADVLEIFKELYEIGYPIEKMRLIDEYGADDERSMEDNNSSAFCYRTVAESKSLSKHAYGMAIDINPFYNPYHYTRADGSLFLQPEGSQKYIDRDLDEPYMIKQGDACYRIFTSHGFTWGGEWNTKKDYQHFEK
ncbi:MAG: M15 family metallopeptidase [Lachnospiraceae bacterium]|nr:M15 family metallopeptidase [Lachnospiraceae bacterium]